MKTLTLFTTTLLISTIAFAATPAETAIEKAQAEIAKHPDHAQFYSTLAMAYARRARETSDAQYYAKAEETLQHSFALAPDNYDGLKTLAWLQLGRHEFAKALETATKLNKKTPDDVMVYGYLVDANVELGNYKEAVAAAQWMLDLRPGNIPGLARAGYLRELHGNLPGAIDLMQMAYGSTPSTETEDRAWLLTQVAHLNFVMGDLDKAESMRAPRSACFRTITTLWARSRRCESLRNAMTMPSRCCANAMSTDLTRKIYTHSLRRWNWPVKRKNRRPHSPNSSASRWLKPISATIPTMN